jgi:ribosome-binding factor A
MSPRTHTNKGPSQRQLRVGELVRHALAEVFSRGEAGVEFDGVLLSFAEVRMSADLKHATALVAPLAGADSEALIRALNLHARSLRGKITPALRQMRMMPDLKFHLDTRFEDDARIDALLRSPEVARDLQHDPEKWEPAFGQDHAQAKNKHDDEDEG